MPIVLVYVSILVNIVFSLAYACRHGIALNMLTAGAACNATRLLYLGVHTARAARVLLKQPIKMLRPMKASVREKNTTSARGL